MKKIILCLFLLSGCMKTTILNAPIEREVADTMCRTKAHKDFDSTFINVSVDSTLNEDTTRILIEFNPTVEDWEETNEDV